jgi:hypothetical protein
VAAGREIFLQKPVEIDSTDDVLITLINPCLLFRGGTCNTVIPVSDSDILILVMYILQ